MSFRSIFVGLISREKIPDYISIMDDEIIRNGQNGFLLPAPDMPEEKRNTKVRKSLTLFSGRNIWLKK